jgi:chemotaxis protein MotA
MDLASVIGLVLGVAVMVISILISDGATFGAFVDYPSIMVVGGGAVAAVLISFPLKNFMMLGGVMKLVFVNKQQSIPELIDLIVSLAETARRDGLLALESKLAEVDNSFVVLGIQMSVDGTPQEVIEDIMRTEMDAVAARHSAGKALVDQLGRYAPAYGMIGTLLGLIIMLGNMDDPSSIGSGMAVALLTTLYGAIVSNLVCLPFAEKLGFLHKQEMLAMEIALRGVLGIQAGDNPRVIAQKLRTFIPPKLREAEKQAA